LIDSVTDAQILDAYALVARTEGVFAEPACAAPLAGIRKLAESGYFIPFTDREYTVTATLTGHGLKDPDRAVKTVTSGIVEVIGERSAILREIGF